MKKQIAKLLTVFLIAISLGSCKKDSVETDNITLEQLGVNNFNTSVLGIKGFNHLGNPIVYNDLNVLYEYNETNNTFNKLGNTVPNPASIGFAKVVQDGIGDYYYHSGTQGDVYILNKTTNEWDIVTIAPGYKNQMVANANGDILVYINNTTIGGIESYYKKAATSNNWVKVLDMPLNNSNQLTPQFLSNTGLAFFVVATNSSMGIDGEGNYNDFVLNTNTGVLSKFYDKTEPENLLVTAPYAYTGFYSNYCSADGTFYSLVREQNGTKTALYKISSSTIPAKFVKVTEYYHLPLDDGSTHIIYGCKINESAGVVKFKSSCKFTNYSHHNLGVTSTSSPDVKVLQHDGEQSAIYSSPNGTVYVLRGYLFKWK